MVYEYEHNIINELEQLEDEYKSSYKNEINEVREIYRKAKAFDELKKYVDEEGDIYMDLYRKTKEPAYSLLNSHYDTLLGFIEELEDE